MHYAGWTCQFSAHADKNAVLTFEIMHGEENSKTHFRSSPSWENHVNGGVFFPTQLIGHQLDWLEESQELVDQSPVFPLEFEFFIPLA